ncbi:peroxiredoxin [Rhizobium giardinii]|uniref:Peroxiredoxin (Alkyl hydroperoxide reductase subunit C) n=1 Tax=Rhizobium giardinii TaxID=56731 RepID=A0A7W8UD46_9HYPH|nr:peroxiredoxin [Rhizobium giardinii]MBB5537181.1 peroxiredoxin (alkyl hydroperoxide reductase subunit C) [Rhizobium giardinii]
MSDIPSIAPPGMNDAAPGFTARSTAGTIALSGFRGRWLVFFSHPADFTPVCTSEFIAFAKATPEFDKLDCALLALSVDSLHSHVAWLRDIHDRFGVKIAFPVLEDPSMIIARAYGMLDNGAPSSATVRATYVIDPAGIIRAIVWYPMNVGRSVDELLRLVAALQAADRESASTPEGWRPGQNLIEQAGLALDVSSDDIRNGEAWYFREKRA